MGRSRDSVNRSNGHAKSYQWRIKVSSLGVADLLPRFGHVSVVPSRITYREAAEILGVHLSNVAKLIRKGELHSDRRRNGALTASVEALARRRAAAQAVAKTRRTGPRRPIDSWPDLDHVWLKPTKVATRLDLSNGAAPLGFVAALCLSVASSVELLLDRGIRRCGVSSADDECDHHGCDRRHGAADRANRRSDVPAGNRGGLRDMFEHAAYVIE